MLREKQGPARNRIGHDATNLGGLAESVVQGFARCKVQTSEVCSFINAAGKARSCQKSDRPRCTKPRRSCRECSSRFCALPSPDLRGLLFYQCCGKSEVLPEIGSATMHQTSEVLQVQGVWTTKTTKEGCSLGAPFRVFRGLSRISWSKRLAWGRQCAWQTTCQRKTLYRTRLGDRGNTLQSFGRTCPGRFVPELCTKTATGGRRSPVTRLASQRQSATAPAPGCGLG
jgi:hypothetical protein